MRTLLALMFVRWAMRLDGQTVIAALWQGIENVNTEDGGIAEDMLAQARQDFEERVVH